MSHTLSHALVIIESFIHWIINKKKHTFQLILCNKGFFCHYSLAILMMSWVKTLTSCYICWDTPSEKTGLWQLPIVSSALKYSTVNGVVYEAPVPFLFFIFSPSFSQTVEEKNSSELRLVFPLCFCWEIAPFALSSFKMRFRNSNLGQDGLTVECVSQSQPLLNKAGM